MKKIFTAFLLFSAATIITGCAFAQSLQNNESEWRDDIIPARIQIKKEKTHEIDITDFSKVVGKNIDATEETENKEIEPSKMPEPTEIEGIIPEENIIPSSNIQSKTAVSSQNNKVNKNGFAVEISDVWTPTFQLCWNEFVKLIGAEKVEYISGNPPLADELNKQKFDKSELNEKDYYISVSKMTKTHKAEIENVIKQKFNEKSDILGQFIFPDIKDDSTHDWFIYSILVKNFPFSVAYDILPSDYFGKIKTDKYKFFGFNDNTENKKAKNIAEVNSEVIFYADDNDFALKILNKNQREEMILYLTDSDASFDAIYEEMNKKSKNREKYDKKRMDELTEKYPDALFDGFKNNYKIPYLHIDQELNYDKDLSLKAIKDGSYNETGNTWLILKTLQTVKFDLNNEGAKLKSEAAISVMKTALMPDNQPKVYLYNNFCFDRPFVIFLKEADKDKPYFAARIKDGKHLIKE